MGLVDALNDPDRRRAVVRDGAQLIDDEVRSKRGLSGAALRAGYRTVRKFQPSIVESALEHLLPRFAPQVDPFWERAVASGDPQRYFDQHADDIAEALLSVTDERARVSRHAVLVRVYTSLRGQAHRHTAAAVPRLPALIQRHSPGLSDG